MIKTYSLVVNLNGVLKAFTGQRYHMSKMNGVSNLLATWVRLTLSRKHIYTSNRNTNGLLGKAVGEGLTFLKYAFVYLLNGHFIGSGPKRLKYMLLHTGITGPMCLNATVLLSLRRGGGVGRLSHLHLTNILLGPQLNEWWESAAATHGELVRNAKTAPQSH